MKNYMFDDSLYAEQFNTLLLVDQTLADKQFDAKPVFYLVGGTAILLHGVASVFTVDIDCANKLTEQVKEATYELISDMASSVVKLPRLYETRLVRFKDDVFENCHIFLVSIPDIIITKCAAFRTKDKQDLITTDLMDRCDPNTVLHIIDTELPAEKRKGMRAKFLDMYEERQEYKVKE